VFSPVDPDSSFVAVPKDDASDLSRVAKCRVVRVGLMSISGVLYDVSFSRRDERALRDARRELTYSLLSTK